MNFVGRDVIQALIKKTSKVLPGDFEWHVRYVFFARQEFTDAAKSLAAEHHALLVNLAQIEADMHQWLQVPSR